MMSQSENDASLNPNSLDSSTATKQLMKLQYDALGPCLLLSRKAASKVVRAIVIKE